MITMGRKIRSQVDDEQIAKQEEQARREREEKLNAEIERIEGEKETIWQKISDFSKRENDKNAENWRYSEV